MTTILYHVSKGGAFLAADTLRHNTVSGTTSRVRKVFPVTARVLLAGGGISNGVAHLRGGLRGHLSQDQDASFSRVVNCVLQGIEECFNRGNADRISGGLTALPLVIYLAGVNEHGQPTIELIEQNTTGRTRATFNNTLGCISVESNQAKAASIGCYEALRDNGEDGSVHLAEWALASVLDHENMFSGKVGAPIDCGLVTPAEEIAFALNYTRHRMEQSFTMEGLRDLS